MLYINFQDVKDGIAQGIVCPAWDESTGKDVEQLRAECLQMEKDMGNASHMAKRASIFAHILQYGRIARNTSDIFEDRLCHGGILGSISGEWYRACVQNDIAEVSQATRDGVLVGAWDGNSDHSHTAPDWDRLLTLGISGIVRELRNAMEQKKTNGTLTDEQRDFYQSCILVWEAVIAYLERLGRYAESLPETPATRMAAELDFALAKRAPETFPEALKLMNLMYLLQNDMEGTYVRSFGRLDRHLLPFFKKDVAEGRYTPEELDDVLRCFYCRINAMNHPNNVPICLGGGEDNANELSYRFHKIFDELGYYCPKFQIRVTENTPDDFLKAILDSIRRGNSSYVFMNDPVVIEGLTRIGLTAEDADNYIPVGCYESLSLGKELACTCAGLVNIPKALELALHDGVDPLTGKQIGVHSGRAEDMRTMEDFRNAVYAQLANSIAQAEKRVLAYESILPEINPSPIFSSTIASCVEQGRDGYASGMTYNTSSINCIGIANAADSMLAVEKLVYVEKRVTLAELRDILLKNWEDAEILRKYALERCPKYGNGDSVADAVAVELSDFCAKRINGVKNARNDVFRMGLFSIDWGYPYGKKMSATPDGRFSGEPLSKNIGAEVGMDRNGATAMAKSASNLHLKDAVNGAVLDMMIHPTAVQGEAGLDALLRLLRTFFRRGGQCIQFNILDAEQLKRAKANPEKYASLQVRVCGWNAYFVNLSEPEQDAFIRQAEGEEACGA